MHSSTTITVLTAFAGLALAIPAPLRDTPSRTSTQRSDTSLNGRNVPHDDKELYPGGKSESLSDKLVKLIIRQDWSGSGDEDDEWDSDDSYPSNTDTADVQGDETDSDVYWGYADWDGEGSRCRIGSDLNHDSSAEQLDVGDDGNQDDASESDWAHTTHEKLTCPEEEDGSEQWGYEDDYPETSTVLNYDLTEEEPAYLDDADEGDFTEDKSYAIDDYDMGKLNDGTADLDWADGASDTSTDEDPWSGEENHSDASVDSEDYSFPRYKGTADEGDTSGDESSEDEETEWDDEEWDGEGDEQLGWSGGDEAQGFDESCEGEHEDKKLCCCCDMSTIEVICQIKELWDCLCNKVMCPREAPTVWQRPTMPTGLAEV